MELVEIKKSLSKNETDSSFKNVIHSTKSRVVKSDAVLALIEEMTRMMSGVGKNTQIDFAATTR